jgi:hypothetical protein
MTTITLRYALPVGIFAFATSTFDNTHATAAPMSAPIASAELEPSSTIFSIKGDPAYGLYLGAECKGCHSNGSGNVPMIEGSDRQTFIIAMHA